jgi:HEAT repeat protein
MRLIAYKVFWRGAASVVTLGLVLGCGKEAPPEPVAKADAAPGEAAPALVVTPVVPPPAPTLARQIIVRRPISQDLTMKDTAIDALARIGRPAVPEIVKMLDDPSSSVRVEGLRALARIGPDAADAVPAVLKLMEDKDEMVRKSAVRALGQIGAPAAPAVPAIIEILKEPPDLPKSP